MSSNGKKYDVLLRYLSEKGSGSWEELKEAWQWIGGTDDPSGRAWIAARDLEALGHIEVAWNQQLTWCAAPPLLTMIPRSGGRAFVTGARTGHFLDQLSKAAEAQDVWIDHCGLQRGPTSYYLACRSHLKLEALAAELGVDYTYQVAEQIAGLLPPLETYSSLTDDRELPKGLELELFNTDRLEWIDTDQRELPGLYRCRTYGGQLHGLRSATGAWSRVIKEIGIYEVLRWEGKSVLDYSQEDETLTLSAEASLPTLHARAATLCSGQLPRYSRPPLQQPRSRQAGLSSRRSRLRGGRTGNSQSRPQRTERRARGTLTYANVPLSIAERIAGSLSQRLDGGAP